MCRTLYEQERLHHQQGHDEPTPAPSTRPHPGQKLPGEKSELSKAQIRKMKKTEDPNKSEEGKGNQEISDGKCFFLI